MDLSRLADQRAQTPDSSILAREARSSVRRPVQTVTEERPETALTRREARVKAILLKELAKLNGGPLLGGLSYVEKKRLEKRLDVAYLDREIAKMRKSLRLTSLSNLRWLLFAAVALFLCGSQYFRSGFDAWLILPLLNLLVVPLARHFEARATRRRIFIYEALRELSDADEVDVVLSRAVQDADRLIRDLVDRELVSART